MAMTFGSLFSGAGGFDLGLDRAGMRCCWQVEIDRRASSVLRRHWPKVPRHDDVKTFRCDQFERPDLIVGGSPCQGFSVAGLRDGVDDDRSGLFREMVRVVAEMRPRYVLWENVPGVFSGHNEIRAGRGTDGDATGQPVRIWWMGAIVRAFSDSGYVGAWRILDARHFGVPQRRRRVFGLFTRDTGDDSGAARCAEILALTGSVPGDHPTSEEAGEAVAGTLAPSLVSSGRGVARIGESRDQDCVVPVIAMALTTSAQRLDYETETLIPVLTHSLTSAGHDASEDGTGRGTPLVAVAFQTSQSGVRTSDTHATLDSSRRHHGATVGQAVRRLTPRECERIMSWPDDHTRYDDLGREIADGPRYRMIGNGVVSNVAEWIGRRIIAATA